MNELQIIASTALALLSGIGGWFLARRQRTATAVGSELANEGAAIDLYREMTEIAQGQQERMGDMQRELDTFRRELSTCIEARDQTRRERIAEAQQGRIDRSAQEVVIAKLKHDLTVVQAEVQTMREQARRSTQQPKEPPSAVPI